MFKKMIVLMLALTVFTVQVQASTQDGLKAAFDELSFALNVEWDQKDEAFKNEKIKEFTNSISKLQEKGLTTNEMVAFVKTQVKDAKVARDIETAFSMIQINKMSAADANAYMMETMKKSYAQGASYVSTLQFVLGVAAIAGLVGLSIILMQCPPGQRRFCDTYCNYYNCWDDCYCY